MSKWPPDFKFGDVLRMDGPFAGYPERRVMYLGAPMTGDSQPVVLIKKDPHEDGALFTVRNQKVGDVFNITARVWVRVDEPD